NVSDAGPGTRRELRPKRTSDVRNELIHWQHDRGGDERFELTELLPEWFALEERGAVAAESLEHGDGAERQPAVPREVCSCVGEDGRWTARKLREGVGIDEHGTGHRFGSRKGRVISRRSDALMPARLPRAKAISASGRGPMSTSSP